MNQRCWGGERYTIVMMFGGEVVSVLAGIPVLFLLLETHGAGVFHSSLSLDKGKAVKRADCTIFF